MDELIVGVPAAVLVAGLVEMAKRTGLPSRWAGLAAIVIATTLVALVDLAAGDGSVASVAGWLLAGAVYGFAASGLYSQARLARDARPAPDGAGATGER